MKNGEKIKEVTKNNEIKVVDVKNMKQEDLQRVYDAHMVLKKIHDNHEND